MAESSKQGGMHVLYGVVIGDAIARGDVTHMKKVLADSKNLLASQGDLKSQIANLEAAIEQITPTPGVYAADVAPKNDGHFTVDLKALKLSSERLSHIERAIQETVVNSIADIDVVAKGGTEIFKRPVTAGIVVRDF
jgi:Domain of unknown function (DUF1843)